MNISLLEVDRENWNEFVISSPDSTFFSLYEYYETLDSEFHFLTVLDQNDKIKGGLVYRIRGTAFPANLIVKSIWVESGILSNVSDKEENDKIKILLLAKLVEEAKRRRCILIRFNHWCREKNRELFIKAEYETVPNSTFIIDLTQGTSELFKSQSKGHRATLKKALTKGVRFCLSNKPNETEIDEFTRLHVETYLRARGNNDNTTMTRKSPAFLKGIVNNNNLPVYLVGAYVGDKLAAGALLVAVRNIVYYYLGASDVNLNREYGASNLLIWESIIWAKETGLQFFDMGGVPSEPKLNSPAIGVYNFKKNFGGSLCTYYGGQKNISPIRSGLFNFVMTHRGIIRIFPFVK